MVCILVCWLNCNPLEDGLNKFKLTYYHHRVTHQAKQTRKLEFGTYVQINDQHDNSLLPQTSGAIALRPTNNELVNLSKITYRQKKQKHLSYCPF